MSLVTTLRSLSCCPGSVALGVSLEYLSAPVFKNNYEFAYTPLEHEDDYGYRVRNFDGAPAIGIGSGNQMGFFADLMRQWDGNAKSLMPARSPGKST